MGRECQICAGSFKWLCRGACWRCNYLCDPEFRAKRQAEKAARYHRLHPEAKYVPEKPKVRMCIRCKKREAAERDKLCLTCIVAEVKEKDRKMMKRLQLQRFQADEEVRREGEWWNRRLPEGCRPQIVEPIYEQGYDWNGRAGEVGKLRRHGAIYGERLG